MSNIPETQKDQAQVDRRQSPRTRVGSRIQVGLKRVTPAFRAESEEEQEVDAGRYGALVHNISDIGMCITTDEPLETFAFVDISVSQPSRLTKKKRYSGVIVWGTEQRDKKTYRYGIEFVSSWIQRTFYRKNKKMRFKSTKRSLL